MSSGSRQLAERLLGNVGVKIGGTEPTSITVHDERLWDRVIAQRQLGFGEAYMDGQWSSPDLEALLELAALNRSALGLRAVRDRLGVVMQDDQLLSGEAFPEVVPPPLRRLRHRHTGQVGGVGQAHPCVM